MDRVHPDNPLRELGHTQARLSHLEYPAEVVYGILVCGWIEVNLNVCSMRMDWNILALTILRLVRTTAV